MISEEKQIIHRVLEHFVKTGSAEDGSVAVIRLAENKTSTMEFVGGENRTVLLDEYKVGDRVIWGAYSTRTNTVHFSPVTQR